VKKLSKFDHETIASFCKELKFQRLFNYIKIGRKQNHDTPHYLFRRDEDAIYLNVIDGDDLLNMGYLAIRISTLNHAH
jgi:hypothetical protein